MMRRALALAARGLGRTSPNPAVGAVLCGPRGQVLATGWHKRAGLDHAEVAALRRLGFRAPGATLYVTLEPCDHQGRTPPCTRALVDAMVARVVYAIEDPDPLVRGDGHRQLEEAGIAVEVGDGAEDKILAKLAQRAVLNVFNRYQFDNPNTDPMNTNFGTVQQQTAATNRFLQFQGRIQY